MGRRAPRWDAAFVDRGPQGGVDGARQAGIGMRVCNPDDSLRDAARLLLEGDDGCLLVRALDEDDRIAGPITDRDISMAVSRRMRPPALLDEQCQRLAIVSLVPLGAGDAASLAGEEPSR